MGEGHLTRFWSGTSNYTCFKHMPVPYACFLKSIPDLIMILQKLPIHSVCAVMKLTGQFDRSENAASGQDLAPPPFKDIFMELQIVQVFFSLYLSFVQL